MMNHPSMTTRGRRIAALIGLAVVFFLPKRVECGYPGADCPVKCRPYEVEPFGFYVIEYFANRDIGFAYSSGEDCR
jgi:hypothetical protein